MERHILTETDIQNANTYMPLVKKVALAQLVAPLCVGKMEVAINDSDGQKPLPDMGQILQIRRIMFETGVLVGFYLNKAFDTIKNADGEDIPFCMSADEVDRWENIETQIDRLKKNKSCADKCFELLNDFHAFKKILNTEINSQMSVRNDVVGRLVQAFNAPVDADSLSELLESVAKIQKAEVEGMTSR